VNGCFWHRHIGCAKSTLPVTNRAWWVAKLRRNRARDRRNVRDLRTAGWRVIGVWECELGVSRGTATERSARLERFGRSLVHKVTARHKHRHALNVTRAHTA
jgi:DNA mismatch endonuclease (patch repair protein)